MTREEILALPPSTSIVEAGKAFGMSRMTAYKHARLGTFPVPVIKIGRNYRVAAAHIQEALGLTPS